MPQIVQLRNEMNGGFSALSYAINAMHSDIVARFEAHDRRFDAQDEKFIDLKRHMHMLHEDALERIARLSDR